MNGGPHFAPPKKKMGSSCVCKWKMGDGVIVLCIYYAISSGRKSPKFKWFGGYLVSKRLCFMSSHRHCCIIHKKRRLMKLQIFWRGDSSWSVFSFLSVIEGPNCPWFLALKVDCKWEDAWTWHKSESWIYSISEQLRENVRGPCMDLEIQLEFGNNLLSIALSKVTANKERSFFRWVKGL